MIRRIDHDATPEELQATIEDLNADIRVMTRRIRRTSYADAVNIEHTSVNLKSTWMLLKRELTARRDDLRRQLERKEKELEHEQQEDLLQNRRLQKGTAADLLPALQTAGAGDVSGLLQKRSGTVRPDNGQAGSWKEKESR